MWPIAVGVLSFCGYHFLRKHSQIQANATISPISPISVRLHRLISSSIPKSPPRTSLDRIVHGPSDTYTLTEYTCGVQYPFPTLQKTYHYWNFWHPVSGEFLFELIAECNKKSYHTIAIDDRLKIRDWICNWSNSIIISMLHIRKKLIAQTLTASDLQEIIIEYEEKQREKHKIDNNFTISIGADSLLFISLQGWARCLFLQNFGIHDNNLLLLIWKYSLEGCFRSSEFMDLVDLMAN
jgi:hypothetical protein